MKWTGLEAHLGKYSAHAFEKHIVSRDDFITNLVVDLVAQFMKCNVRWQTANKGMGGGITVEICSTNYWWGSREYTRHHCLPQRWPFFRWCYTQRDRLQTLFSALHCQCCEMSAGNRMHLIWRPGKKIDLQVTEHQLISTPKCALRKQLGTKRPPGFNTAIDQSLNMCWSNEIFHCNYTWIHQIVLNVQNVVNCILDSKLGVLRNDLFVAEVLCYLLINIVTPALWGSCAAVNWQGYSGRLHNTAVCLSRRLQHCIVKECVLSGGYLLAVSALGSERPVWSEGRFFRGTRSFQKGLQYRVWKYHTKPSESNPLRVEEQEAFWVNLTVFNTKSVYFQVN